MRASVIICSYNPNLSVLMKVLSSIKAQTVDETLFETILIDNNTPGGIKIPASAEVPGNFRVVTEPVPGLAYARLAGIREAKSDLIIFADDDNVLSSVYIEESLKIAAQYNYLGA